LRRSRKLLIPILVTLVCLSFCMPASASGYTNYEHDDIEEVKGVWSVLNNRAVETEGDDEYYHCEIVFTFEGITQSADDYWIHLDYNTIYPGWPWIESLEVEYRWSDEQDYTRLVLCDVYAYEGDIDITAATSSVLYIRMIDCDDDDTVGTSWYFGDEPYVVTWTE
jgi:hypothetical protein